MRRCIFVGGLNDPQANNTTLFIVIVVVQFYQVFLEVNIDFSSLN